MDYVSPIDFGVHEIASGTKTYKAQTLEPFIQVTDRRGTGAGWAVPAQASEFTNDEAEAETETETETLPSSIIAFKNGEAVSAGNSEEPTSADSVVLNTGGDSVSVVIARENEGLGTWVNRWFPTEGGATLNDNVILEIPGGTATIGKHTSTITWILIGFKISESFSVDDIV